MDILKMIDARHSVRAYRDKKLDPELIPTIQAEIDQINKQSGLHIQFIEGAGDVFNGWMSKLAGWKSVPAGYLALVGRDTDGGLEERCGYYGEYLVLFLQSLGLNTCWVGMFNRKAVKADVSDGERVVITVAVGYGANAGCDHKSKSVDKITDVKDMPDWFRTGIACALKAPTAINQQKFFITLDGDTPRMRVAGKGPFVRVDYGIVKYHFEAGSGRKLQ